jgi:MATE family multidrug resistance protein
MLSFLPMVGMSIATATLVGRYIGMDEPRLAEKSVRSALKLAMGYMAIMALMFLTFPDVFIEVFRSRGDAQAGFAAIIAKGVPLLRLIAVYTLFDTLFIVYSGALRGAGDTRFAMWAQIIVAWAFFVPPVYLIVDYFKMGLVAAWLWGVVYVIVLGVLFWARFTSGYWKTIHMIRQG